MRFARKPGAVLPIFFGLILIGCTGGLAEAEQRYTAGVKLQREGRLPTAPVVFKDRALSRRCGD